MAVDTLGGGTGAGCGSGTPVIGGAPANAQYVVLALNDNLTEDRRLRVDTTYLSLTDAGANADVTLSLAAAVIAKLAGVAALTTKGDLLSFTTVPARVGVGANGTVPTANSGAAAGWEWLAPSGGVTSVTAGAGLTGGGTGAVTLNAVAGDATIVVGADSIVVGVIATANITDAQVTAAKMFSLAGASVLGRSASGAAGVMAAITGSTIGHVLTVQGDNSLAFSAPAASGYTTVENNGTPVTSRSTINLSTEFTAADTASKTAVALTTAGVAFAKIANGSGRSVLGRSLGSAGVMASIVGAGAGTVLHDNGTSLAFRTLDHSELGSLAADQHTQYALLLGRSGGQTLIGGTASGNSLTLQSTSHATKGTVTLGSSSGVVFDETLNFVSAGSAPSNSTGFAAKIQVHGTAANLACFWADDGSTSGRAGYVATTNSGSHIHIISYAISAGVASGAYTPPRTAAGTGVLSSTGTLQIFTPGVVDLLLGTNGTERLTLTGAGNIGIGATGSTNYQSMVGGLFWKNATTAPTGNPTGGGFPYFDPTTGDFMVRMPSGNIVTLAVN